MLDKKLLRKEKELYEESCLKRGCSSNYSEFWNLDQESRAAIKEEEEAKSKQKNFKSSGPEAMALKNEIDVLNKKRDILEKKMNDWLLHQPNILSADTPFGKDVNDNKEIFSWGSEFKRENSKPHYEILENLQLKNEAAELSGSRFVVLKKGLATLHRCLAMWMQQKNKEFGFEEYIVPYLVNEACLVGTSQLPKFADDAFKTTENKWLISTGEIPLVNIFRNYVFEEDELPKKITTYTPCFRSEAGAAGRDTRGLIRLHQFHKVELVSICKPEQAGALHEYKLECAKKLLQELKIPYRVMLLCGADAGFGAHKQYDIEFWMPGQGRYVEIASCSQCSDFQARRANIRYKKDGKMEFVNTLNGSALPIERLLAAIMETYLNSDGSVEIPDALKNICQGSRIDLNGEII